MRLSSLPASVEGLQPVNSQALRSGQNMAIKIESHNHVTVSKSFLNRANARTRLDQMRRMRMAQVVEPNSGHRACHDEAPKLRRSEIGI